MYSCNTGNFCEQIWQWLLYKWCVLSYDEAANSKVEEYNGINGQGFAVFREIVRQESKGG